MSLRELVVPRVSGPVGSEVDGRYGVLDANGIEHPNWPNTTQGRLTYVKDPSGAGDTVLRWEIRDDDLADKQYGPDGQRIEMWSSPYDQVNGTESWCCIPWFLGDGVKGDLFHRPAHWCLFFQQFDKPNGPPCFEITQDESLYPGKWQGVARTKELSQGIEVRKVLADATLGHWHTFLIYTKHSTGSDGLIQVRHAADRLPSLNDPLVAQWQQRTLYDGQGHPAWHIYRKDGAASEYPCVGYSRPFTRANTAARALELVRWPAGSPPPSAPTNRELADKAEAAFKRATVLYPTYAKNLAAGKYPDPSKTAWGEGLDALGRIA
jgi:hypothetical protein